MLSRRRRRQRNFVDGGGSAIQTMGNGAGLGCWLAGNAQAIITCGLGFGVAQGAGV
ncbi:hypothetical protein Hanom_Chr01g00085921 [Helianthus anomalus]